MSGHEASRLPQLASYTPVAPPPPVYFAPPSSKDMLSNDRPKLHHLHDWSISMTLPPLKPGSSALVDARLPARLR